MSFRTVIISNNCKIDYKLKYLMIRYSNLETKQIHLSEIAVVIFETTAISITGVILSELIKNKIKVIFCDEKRNPLSELNSYYGSHDTSNKLQQQINWKCDSITKVWTLIVKEKILNQSTLLKKLEKDQYKLLIKYSEEIEDMDATNREGHAAKVYFNSLFGNDFSRKNEIVTNAALNYGYTLLLSMFNREIVSSGYITQIGIFHKNMFNKFNLASDLMEPFRILVDEYVIKNDFKKFDRDEKHIMCDFLNSELTIDNKKHFLLNAVKIYCRSIFQLLNNESNEFVCFRYEF